MLGSLAEADDAVQETYLRLSRSQADGIENPDGWLRTVVGRVCLDHLRARKARREEPLNEAEPLGNKQPNAEEEAILADSVGLALLIVLDTLNPAERVAFVLHDMFEVPFEDIATVVGKSPEATRQLASRARRRVKESDTISNPDRVRQEELIRAFRAASKGGYFDTLLSLLDPNILLRADRTAVRIGAAPQLRGAYGVAKTFNGQAQAARLALVDGVPGMVWPNPAGKPIVVFTFRIAKGKIVAIGLQANKERLAEIDVRILAD